MQPKPVGTGPLTPRRLQMNWGEIAGGSYPSRGQSILDRRPRLRIEQPILGLAGEPYRIHEPADGATRQRERREFKAGNSAQKLLVTHRRRPSQSKDFIDSTELDPAQGTRHLRKPVV